MWTNEEEEYLKSIASGRSRKEIIELIHKRFGTQLRYEQLKCKMYSLKIRTDIGSSGIGKERIINSGYVQVKTGRNKWEFKHKVVYENHYGKIAKNNCVIFLDGDKTNFDINNLAKVSKGQLIVINRHNLIRNNPELTKAGIQIASLIMKTNEAKRRMEK